jgi:hypothetical protein
VQSAPSGLVPLRSSSAAFLASNCNIQFLAHTPLTTDKGQQIMSADSAELQFVYFNSEMAIAFLINSFGAA